MNWKALAGLLVVFPLVGCEREPQEGTRLGAPDSPAVTQTPAPAPGTPAGVGAGESARAEIINTQGERIGEARITESGEGVQIAIQVSNLPPGPKGFHIHQTGRCDPPSFESADGHFAPQGRQHGFEDPRGPHAGDLPNLTVQQDGRADTTVVAREVTLREGVENSLLKPDGTALVIHQNPDDYRTDPSGNSGPRIACGVISRG